MRAMGKVCRKRILVSVPQLAYQYRQGVEGILHYVKKYKAAFWDSTPEIEVFPNTKLLNPSQFDGILAHVETAESWDRILDANVPTVLHDPFLSFDELKRRWRPNTTFITHDYREGGHVAARYFLARHFRNFAYVGFPGESPLPGEQRQIGFVQELERNGLPCRIYPHAALPDGNTDHERLAEWLRTLPRATGVFCVRDARALDVLSAASSIDLNVPEHLSVLGFDNDETLCETSTPQLSSISANLHAFGFEAARQLDRLLSGHPGEVVVCKPNLQVMTRASTALDAVDDPFVARALSWMRMHLTEDSTIDSVAEGVGCSTRFLQRRFQKTLGCSIGDEFRHLKLETALSLLETSEKTLTQVADECGFSNASYLCQCIRKVTGQTPAQCR